MITINEYLEDFDNSELSDYDRHEQLREAVIDYNDQYCTAYDPEKNSKSLRSLATF